MIILKVIHLLMKSKDKNIWQVSSLFFSVHRVEILELCKVC